MARTKRGETGDTPYQEFTRTGGVPVRAWTRGVLFEDAAQRQLLNIARLPFVHSHVAATNGAQEDWIAVLDAMVRNNDRVAYAKVTAVITGWLAHYRAYDFRDSWDDLIHEVLIRLIKSHCGGAIREPSAFISYVGKITRNLFLDWIGPENRHRDLPERLQTDVETREGCSVRRSQLDHSSYCDRTPRAVEGTRLESACTRKGTVGSNPTLSAK